MLNDIANTKVMIAGVGGASLGTEIKKCLNLADGYEIYGCDISKTAYGLYDKGFEKVFQINAGNYVKNVIDVCLKVGIEFLVPGGEQPMVLLSNEASLIEKAGIKLLANSQKVIRTFSNKDTAFKLLNKKGIKIPRTKIVNTSDDVEVVGLPCIIKPATESGGSTSVFFAINMEEALIYSDFIRKTGGTPLAQQYISEDEGEFTIGVLSFPDRKVYGSIALRRSLDAKLSVMYKARGGIISSGYSQGYIAEFPDLCKQAEEIAQAIGSQGPINIQGRVLDGDLIPFEINPRFSASSYLRALAGFNEVDIFIRNQRGETSIPRKKILEGWYLRSLTEQYVSNLSTSND